jgi:hypothetical protein
MDSWLYGRDSMIITVNPYCMIVTVCSSLYDRHCMIGTVWWSLYDRHCMIVTVWSSLYDGHCMIALYDGHCMMVTVWSAPYDRHCMIIWSFLLDYPGITSDGKCTLSSWRAYSILQQRSTQCAYSTNGSLSQIAFPLQSNNHWHLEFIHNLSTTYDQPIFTNPIIHFIDMTWRVAWLVARRRQRNARPVEC